MDKEENLSGVMAPCGVEVAAGHGKLNAAVSADEVRGILFAAEELGLKGIISRKLNHAYHAFCLAMWTKPMRWFAVCELFLQHICGKTRSKRLQLVAVEVFLALLEVEKFLFERIAFHRHGLMLFDEFEIRRLVFNELLLNVEDGGVDIGAVREAGGCFHRLKKHLERCCRMCRSGDYRRNIRHWFDPLWCVEVA